MSTAQSTGVRAVVLAGLLVGSVLAMTVTVASPVGAAANSDSFDVVEDATQSDGEITIEGELNDSGDLMIRLYDPADDDVASIKRSPGTGSFSETIDLSTVSFVGGNGELDEGEMSVVVSEGSSFDNFAAEAEDTVVVDDTAPSGSLDGPDDGANLTASPTIEGTASDDVSGTVTAGVDSVELSIQRQDDGYYYDGSAFVDDDSATVTLDGTTDWSYDTAGNITSDGTYDVSAELTDAAGNTKTVTYPYPGTESELTEISYTVDTAAPTLSNVTLTDDTDGDGTIRDGDVVEVSADVTDETSGVENVTVDASALGSGTVELSEDAGDTWSTTVGVDGPTVGEGDVDLTVTATDAFGTAATATTNAVALETSVAGVDTLSVDQDFVGIARDEENLTVTASGVTDPRGNTVADAQVNVEFVGPGTTYEVTVTDGSIDASIDPTAVPNGAATGETAVRIQEADDGEATATVDLVHEAHDLEEGYQMQGTPMPTERTVTEDIDLVTTWNPEDTGEDKWEVTDGERAGEGYYVHGENADARFGYVFNTSFDAGDEARTLHEGFNLVGATEDLTTGDRPSVSADLGATVAFDGSDPFDGNANVNASVRDESEELSGDDGINEDALTVVEDPTGTDVDGFDAYFVYVEDEEVTRIVERLGYDPGDRD